MFATNLSQGIGYIVIGNLYDNVPRPKRLTFFIVLLLSFATGLVKHVTSYSINRELSSLINYLRRMATQVTILKL